MQGMTDFGIPWRLGFRTGLRLLLYVGFLFSLRSRKAYCTSNTVDTKSSVTYESEELLQRDPRPEVRERKYYNGSDSRGTQRKITSKTSSADI